MAINRIPDDAYVLRIRELIRSQHGRDLEFALSPEGTQLINDAFFTRTVNYHHCMLPWIESVFPLAGASVLEIGCGTGAASLPMAKKCTHIDAYDIDPSSLEVACQRARFAGVTNVSFHRLDPTWALPDRISKFRNQITTEFDVVLLPAVLEHLRMDERLAVLETTWSMLRSGGIMVIYDTPNRLYANDVHSFRLPFFNWLPDDLALLYASRSPRTELLKTLAEAADPMETVYRLGRGVSYHEFDLAIGLSELQVIHDGYSRLLTHRSISDGFEGALLDAFERFSPHVPAGFSKQFLELVLRKRWHKLPLLKRHQVRDELLDGTRPALLVEGDQAYLEYDFPAGRYGQVTVEVLKHPWSSVLLLSDLTGRPFFQEDLYSDYSVTEVLQIPVPEGMHAFQVRVTSGEKSLGNQAWVLGLGADVGEAPQAAPRSLRDALPPT